MPGVENLLDGLAITAVPVPGKVPLHLKGLVEPSAEDNVALRVRDRASGGILVWAPSVAGPSPAVERLLCEASCILFDGTFWSTADLPGAAGMAHWPLAGDSGSLAFLRDIAAHRVLVHINNTNPILLPGSPEHTAVVAAGVEVGEEGMELRA